MSVKPLDLQVNIQTIPILAKQQAEILLKASEDQRLADEKNIKDVQKDLEKLKETEESKTAENNLEYEDFYNTSKEKNKKKGHHKKSENTVINTTEKSNKKEDDGKDHISILA